MTDREPQGAPTTVAIIRVEMAHHFWEGDGSDEKIVMDNLRWDIARDDRTVTVLEVDTHAPDGGHDRP